MTRSGFSMPVGGSDFILECSWNELPKLSWYEDTVVSSYGHCLGSVPIPAVFSFATVSDQPGAVAVYTSVEGSQVFNFHKCGDQ